MESDTEQQLRRRIAELEAELAETLEDAVRQGASSYGDTFCADGSPTWESMMGRLVELGRFEITYDVGAHVEGRFLPRKESNGPTQ